ncbi:glutaminase [Nocardia jinanensis]|uniref:Glutaminase n=1 Tax=Nocardia jinanensis TaxID=382504 RepID=A0A917RUD2_9NOCA|nr:glutaminase [Nocardia jinanensis]GGL32764.1 glutaminase [Nocardia jinanensis]
MHSPIADYLQEVLDTVRDDTGGEVAGYIPELAAADPDVLGMAVCTVDGRVYTAGDADIEFSIQSISKPFAYAAALTDRGFATVRAAVGVEPSGEAFNELSLEAESRRPKNPMINAGAIATHQLLVGPHATVAERFERARSFFSTLADRTLELDERVCTSELATADRNLSIAHMLRNYGIIDDDPHEVVEGYTRQCSIKVTVRDLATMGAALVNGGVHPQTGAQVVTPAVARETLAVMAAAGMYDSAGEWFTRVGIPAKSGVAGGLLGALPGQCGIGVVSPRLDRHGNSVRGIKAFHRLSDDMGMHLMESEPHGSTVLRSTTVRDGETWFALQGAVQFIGAESVLAAFQDDTTATGTLVLDLSRVDRITDVGRRMVLEGLRRFVLDGREVVLVDPDGKLPNPDLGDGTFPTVRAGTARGR